MADPSTPWSNLCDMFSCSGEKADYHARTCHSPFAGGMNDVFLGHVTERPLSYLPKDDTEDGSPLVCARRYSSEWDSNPADTNQASPHFFPPPSYLIHPPSQLSYFSPEDQKLSEDKGVEGSKLEQSPLFEAPVRSPSWELGSPTFAAPSSASSCCAPMPMGAEDFSSPTEFADGPAEVKAEDDGSGTEESEPYAKLIYRALMSVPEHKMVLKEIYDWFMAHTDKNKDPSQKGWQNSIRHNLSMNGAFRKVEQERFPDDGKRGFIWVLDQQAIDEGVKSTTRYRKAGPHRRAGKAGTPALQRQASGRKGGQAAKRGHRARAQRLEKAEISTTRATGRKYSRCLPSDVPQPTEAAAPTESSISPYYSHAIQCPSQSILHEPRSCAVQDVIGVSNDFAQQPLFCSQNEMNNFARAEYTQQIAPTSVDPFRAYLAKTLSHCPQKAH